MTTRLFARGAVRCLLLAALAVVSEAGSGRTALLAPASSASAPTPVAGTASTAAVAASTSTGAAAPARAGASRSGPPLPLRTACEADPGDPGRCDPLTLERNPVTLPDAGLGRAYARAVRAEGGQPPYRFDLADGSLPDGLKLDDKGRIAGTPGKAGTSRFRVRVVDAAGAVAGQAYSLRVFAAAKTAARPASVPASALELSQLDLSRVGPPDNPVPTAQVYQLDPAQLDALKAAVASPEPAAGTDAQADGAPATDVAAGAPEPAAAASAPPPTPALPPDLAWSEAQQIQLAALLQPLFALEYPTRGLFEAAVDAQVCAQAKELILHEAQRQGQRPPDQARLATLCLATPAAAASAAKPGAVSAPASGASAAPAGNEQSVPWTRLPAWLMPPGLRDWLADAARRDRPLQPTQPLRWTATPSCNCAAPRRQPVYALYPTWLAGGPQPQTLDFSLVNRISYMSLPLGRADLGQDQATDWTPAQTEFVRTARAHDTRVDFGIYHADWRFLATEPEALREELVQRYTTQVTRHARELLDTPLPGLASQAKAWLPGFGRTQYMGDGITVFFDQVPDPKQGQGRADRFSDFNSRFVKGLAAAMGENRRRSYALNLVMTDRQIEQRGAFDPAHLFDLLLAVEDPEIANGRIVETRWDYKRNNNVELRFLVLLSEPAERSARILGSVISESRGLNESERRILLRSIVPVLLLPQASLPRYRDDLVYLEDNFGGVGFWPAPLMDQQFSAAQAQALRTTFGPDSASRAGQALCGIVCPNRWLFRLAFELLVLAGLVCWLLFAWRCEWRARYGRYALLGVIPPLLVGAALLQCDPDLEALRQGNAQLIALIAIPLVAALWALLKRKEDRP